MINFVTVLQLALLITTLTRQVSAAHVGGSGSNRETIVRHKPKHDRGTEESKHDHVPLDLGKVIQQARGKKTLTQKDLATKINKMVPTIQEYETGKAIPDQNVLSKLEKTLGVKLRGKDLGKPLHPPKTKI